MNNSLFQRFILFLSRHQKGIYITLIFHLLILIVLVSFKINAHHQQNSTQILFDFSTLEPDHSQLTEEEKSELHQQIQAARQNQIHNANVDANVNEKLIDRLDKNVDVYREAAETQQRLQETYQRQTNVPQEKQTESDVPSETPLPSSSKSIDKVAVEYDIPYRKAVKLPTPIYQCQTYGKVIVAVEVNAKGYVVRAGVIRQQSTGDECLQEAALKAAKLSRFTIRESQTDKGTISYLFEAQ